MSNYSTCILKFKHFKGYLMLVSMIRTHYCKVTIQKLYFLIIATVHDYDLLIISTFSLFLFSKLSFFKKTNSSSKTREFLGWFGRQVRRPRV